MSEIFEVSEEWVLSEEWVRHSIVEVRLPTWLFAFNVLSGL